MSLEWEETRRCMMQTCTSHIQTSAGLLIALIIGAFTLISGFSSFYSSSNNIITFGFLLSSLIGAGFYFMGKISYWSLFDNVSVCVLFKDIEIVKQEIAKSLSSERNETIEAKDIGNSYALHLYLKQYKKKNFAKLTLYQKVGALNDWFVPMTFVAGVLSFIVFLQINGFLWQL